MRTRTSLAAAVFAGVATLTAVAPGATGRSGPALTRSHQATPAEPAVRSHGSPAVAVDPDDPRQVFAAGVEFRSGRCAFVRSTDGGTMWRPTPRPPVVPGYPVCTQNLGQMPAAALAIGREKTLYWAHVA